jgi:hypothetical protein
MTTYNITKIAQNQLEISTEFTRMELFQMYDALSYFKKSIIANDDMVDELRVKLAKLLDL